MVNTKEYKELPEILQQWIDQAAEKVDSPARRDAVRASLSIQFLDSLKAEKGNVNAVLLKYGSPEEEARKNEMINQLPDRNQWKVWRFVTIVLGMFVLISIVTLCAIDIPGLTQFFELSTDTIPSPVSNFAGGATPSAIITRAVVFGILGILSLRMMIKEKRRSDEGYQKYESQNAWAKFEGKPFK